MKFSTITVVKPGIYDHAPWCSKKKEKKKRKRLDIPCGDTGLLTQGHTNGEVVHALANFAPVDLVGLSETT